ncbi:DUF7389 domain-containing protein [Haloarchaeobius sp. HRN-SO-5]|uniref:DUF7389 domain-containing protein n=1 Tax=Haloarchaeobius sp. HRN-SO-5 TaxID=3446118 RepID=UPI003EBDB866
MTGDTDPVDDPTTGTVVNHHTPDLFQVRCPECGASKKTRTRPGEKSRICSTCNRLKGVTPLENVRRNSTDRDDEAEQAIATDGGIDESDIVQERAHTAASLLDDAAVALREGEPADALEYINDALTTLGDGVRDDRRAMTDGGREYDTTEKVERTDVGFRLTVESKRGTGTRDQDKVKAELRQEQVPTTEEVENLTRHVEHLMNMRRAHQPDEGDDA